MTQITDLANHLESIGSDAEQQIFQTRIALIVPALLEYFKSSQERKEVLEIIDSLMSISNQYQFAPMYKYLSRAIEIITQTQNTKDIQINFLNSKQTQFIIDNLEGFREILRYLTIGNRRIEKIIPDSLHDAAEKQCLCLFTENWEETIQQSLLNSQQLMNDDC